MAAPEPEVVSRRDEVSVSELDSDAVVSSEASSRSRASEAWAIGELAGSDRLTKETRSPILTMGLGRVDMISPISWMAVSNTDRGVSRHYGPRKIRELVVS